MWGCILTDYVSQPSFSVGYTVMKSDIVIHLSQWQYWWWFWFSFLWGFYYLLSAKVVRGRMLKFRPKMYTSFRSRGKWGDFLACIVPALWCLNILTNSNFIMRLLEWQYELSLFSVRVRGRQWYWVYKFELRHVVDIASMPRNVGNDRWVVSLGNLHEVTNDYVHALNIRSYSPFIKVYWQNIFFVLNKTILNNQYTLSRTKTKLVKSFKVSLNKFNRIHNLSLLPNIVTNSYDAMFMYDTVLNKNSTSVFFKTDPMAWIVNKNFQVLPQRRSLSYHLSLFKTGIKTRLALLKGQVDFLHNMYRPTTRYVDSSGNTVSLFNTNRSSKKFTAKIFPIHLDKPNEKLKQIKTLDVNNWDFVKLKFNRAKQVEVKTLSNIGSLVIKQKRVKENVPVPLRIVSEDADPLIAVRKKLAPIQPTLYSMGWFKDMGLSVNTNYNLIARSHKHAELMSVQLSRRLLRTQRTLVLPAQINLTLITNSYDVVHSWFLPSLGLKMDCVPGRSTHHSFYVDTPGFFYGQCAEICGRYHHHMPIRLCMLPFDHFIVWWQHFGLPKILNLAQPSDEDLHVGPSKFFW